MEAKENEEPMSIFYNSFIFLFYIGGGFCGKTEGQVAYIAHTNAGFFFNKMVISHHFITYELC